MKADNSPAGPPLDGWVCGHRAGQEDIPGDADPAVVVAELRRIVNGDDAPYDGLPPFGRLSELAGWLDKRGYLDA
jgi:hypothetical protein